MSGQQVGAPLPGWSPRPRPYHAQLAGTDVRVEPLTPQHVPGLWEALCADGDAERWTYMPAGPFRDQNELAGYVQGLIDNPTSEALAIRSAQDGAVLGTASYLRIDQANGVVEVGSITYGPRLARTRGATEVMWLMARHVFDDLGYRRYEWKCDALNAPSRRAAERLGFRYEGTFRQAVVYKGRNRDTAWFAMTDGDWTQLRPGYERWLAPDNVDEQGRQRARLAELRRAEP